MKKLFISLILMCFMIVSCSMVNGQPDKPPVEFDPAYVNQQIQLIAIKEMSAFQTKYPVAVLLQSNSRNEIVFPNNFNLRLFIQQDDGKWLEIKEKPTTLPADPIIMSPTALYRHIVMFSPDLDDLTKTYRMRVYVFGEMKTQEGAKQVAAFVDFVLTP